MWMNAVACASAVNQSIRATATQHLTPVIGMSTRLLISGLERTV